MNCALQYLRLRFQHLRRVAVALCIDALTNIVIVIRIMADVHGLRRHLPQIEITICKPIPCDLDFAPPSTMTAPALS
jgi:hypothetical protein